MIRGVLNSIGFGFFTLVAGLTSADEVPTNQALHEYHGSQINGLYFGESGLFTKAWWLASEAFYEYEFTAGVEGAAVLERVTFFWQEEVRKCLFIRFAASNLTKVFIR